MALLIILGKERNHLQFDRWSRARGPFGYLRTRNWPITAHEVSQPYNKKILMSFSIDAIQRFFHFFHFLLLLFLLLFLLLLLLCSILLGHSNDVFLHWENTGNRNYRCKMQLRMAKERVPKDLKLGSPRPISCCRAKAFLLHTVDKAL